MGEALHPRRKHLLALAKTASVSESKAKEVLEQVETAVAKLPRIAKAVGLATATASLVKQRLKEVEREWKG